MGTNMIQAFRELHGNDSRRAALEALTRELSPFEWRDLASRLNARTFQYDIVGNLPVELVTSIFSHLDTSTPYRLQSVRLLPTLKFLTELCIPQKLDVGIDAADRSVGLQALALFASEL
jgi:hypothetical protein